MGGVWGLAASTALENLPVEARGLASGVLQQGYAVGYLLAACINLRLVPESGKTWRTLFWTASGISMFSACVRALVPESAVFIRAKEQEKQRAAEGREALGTWTKTRVFLHETKEMLKKHWLLCIYAVLLMTGECVLPFHFFTASLIQYLGFLTRLLLVCRIQFHVTWLSGKQHSTPYPVSCGLHTPHSAFGVVLAPLPSGRLPNNIIYR